ncbi:venom allergen 5-like [Asbolus verrucosus]|uniref:Venom allergen 5-like n=1 Tax=Asbolus verrucosus TaxID=1661398 RepID=A0A482VC48_ASBVE|nr:venom allergen 5-like [Asbolus verrucosus]
MKILLLNFCFWLQALSTVADFDPTKFDYCSTPCTHYNGRVYEHTACQCRRIEGTRTLIFDDIVEFRTTMVELHNTLRNRVASGGEIENGFPNAANMRVINYDLELEYIANCRAKEFYEGHDQCLKKHDSIHSGQNVAGSTAKRQDVEFYMERVNSWYGEIENVLNPARLIDSFGSEGHVKPNRAIGHFTQIIWAETTRIGCARVWIPDNPVEYRYASVLICNYAGDDGFGGNVLGRSVYKVGTPASQCPSGTTPSDKYTSLCGEVEPIPEREPYNKGDPAGHASDEL